MEETVEEKMEEKLLHCETCNINFEKGVTEDNKCPRCGYLNSVKEVERPKPLPPAPEPKKIKRVECKGCKIRFEKGKLDRCPRCGGKKLVQVKE